MLLSMRISSHHRSFSHGRGICSSVKTAYPTLAHANFNQMCEQGSRTQDWLKNDDHDNVQKED